MCLQDAAGERLIDRERGGAARERRLELARIAALHRITLLGPPGMLPSEAARAAA
jgi:hypothetical protein